MTEQIVPTTVPYSSELMLRVLRRLVARYDFISIESIGKSVAGSDLQVLQLGQGEKTLFVSAAHHANEWITTPVVLKFVEEYADAVQQGTQIAGLDAAALWQAVRLIVLPMVNPDGVDLVNGFFKGVLQENAGFIAENYPDVPYPDGWKANILGTDLNLNYPAGWVKARRLKYAAGFVSPAPRDFVGFAPLSAPESRFLYEYTLRQDFSMILAYHTQGNIIYWKYNGYEPAHSLHIGELLAAASGYSLELTPEYSSYAGYKDWFIKNFDRPGYTIECGQGVSPLPLSDFDGIYEANRPLLATAMHAVEQFL